MTALEVKKISDALVFNRTVTSVNISFNPKISIDGVVAFMAPFSNNANMILSKVYMDGCGVGDEGAKRVCLFFFLPGSWRFVYFNICFFFFFLFFFFFWFV